MGVSGECRVQRLVLAGGERLWTVLGGDHRPVGPAEEFLEYLRVQRVSSNTVKSYAHALALWWQYLQVLGLSWDAVTLEAVGGFLAWLRTGDGPRVVSIEQRPARFAESTIAARLQAVVSCYRYHQFNGVELGRDLVRLVHSRGGSYKPMLEHAARRARRRQAVIRVRRPGRAAPPLLTAGQTERICDACAAWDGEAREWRGCMRDRLLWALLAESGGLVKRSGCSTATGTPAAATRRSSRWCRVIIRTGCGSRAAATASCMSPPSLTASMASTCGSYARPELIWPLVTSTKPSCSWTSRVSRGWRRGGQSRSMTWSGGCAPSWPGRSRRAGHRTGSSTATPRLRRRVPVHVVSRRLGHADVQTTLNIYGNSRELHQAGEKPQVTRSWRYRNSVSDLSDSGNLARHVSGTIPSDAGSAR